MNWLLIIDILRFMTIGLLLLLGLTLYRARQQNQHIWLFVALCVEVIAYLLIDPTLGWVPLLWILLMTGASAIPITFWLLARALFEDHFKMRWQHLLLLVGVLVINYTLLFLRTIPTTPDSVVSILGGFLSQGISLFFIVWAAFVAYAGQKTDLIETRLHFRKYFVLLTTGMIGLTLLTEIVVNQNHPPDFLKFLQILGIAILTYYFTIRNLVFAPEFFLSRTKPAQASEPPPPEMVQKLRELLETEKGYREEGLTIRILAEKMGDKEYKVRRLINQYLGFRNFNDFLNQYRIQEACEILLDPGQAEVTILEISYQLGYQSLGPFNSAFKRQTGLTPTAYRKTNRLPA